MVKVGLPIEKFSGFFCSAIKNASATCVFLQLKVRTGIVKIGC